MTINMAAATMNMELELIEVHRTKEEALDGCQVLHIGGDGFIYALCEGMLIIVADHQTLWLPDEYHTDGMEWAAWSPMEVKG
jgi:hypothetical protein